MGEEKVTVECIRFQMNSVLVVVFICCRVSETFDIATGQDSVILRVVCHMEKITKIRLLNTASYQRRLFNTLRTGDADLRF